MKKYGLISVFILTILSFSSCSSENVEISQDIQIKKVSRSPVTEEKVSRTVVVDEVLVKKLSAKKVEPRTLTFLAYDKDNLLERYGITLKEEVYLGERIQDSLISSRREVEPYDVGLPLRMTEFINSDDTYYEYYEDPNRQKVLGVEYNTREGYLSSAKIDSTTYQRGYIENYSGNSASSSKSTESSSNNTSNSGNTSDENNSNNSDVNSENNSNNNNDNSGSDDDSENNSSSKNEQFFGTQKGYIEAYEDKYNHLPHANTGYLNHTNSGVSQGYIESLGENDTISNSNNYLSELANGYTSNGAKNYLEAMGNNALRSSSQGYLEAMGSDSLALQNGYLENTYVSDFNADGLVDQSNFVSANSYLDLIDISSPSQGYLANLSASSGQKGYLETNSVFGGGSGNQQGYIESYGIYGDNFSNGGSEYVGNNFGNIDDTYLGYYGF